ncbi:MAG: LLM class flavin-dependent oxidoreductase [Nocardioides sp.]|nr:LLM class flavin-dependent oxidoreductase [Nocardioides sp.]
MATDALNLEDLKAYLGRVEELGFAGGWVMEQAIGPTPMLAPLETLAYAAACTTNLRLGVAVLVVPQHDPLQLAAAITAVDRLSGGRLDVGVSPGGGFRPFEAFGVARQTFVGYFVEALELMKAAWADPTEVSFHGRFREVNGLPIQPKPVQRPHPPIWFGASSQRALARAVRLGDAFLGAGSTSTAQFADQVVTLRSELAAQGRDPASYPIGKRVYLAVDDDADRARAAVAEGLDRLYGGAVPGIKDVPVCGTPQDVVAGLREVADAGAELLVLNPLGTSVAEDREQMERLAAEVIPQLS